MLLGDDGDVLILGDPGRGALLRVGLSEEQEPAVSVVGAPLAS